MEFHISREARERYHFDRAFFSVNGEVTVPSVHAVRMFAQEMNRGRDLVRFPEQAIRAGHLNAIGLMDEILHIVVDLYREQKSPDVALRALDWLYDRIGKPAVDTTLRDCADQLPPLAVYGGDVALDDYLVGETGGVPHRLIVLEELVMVWLANRNPAYAPYRELFDDTALASDTAYRQVMSSLEEFFETQPSFGPAAQDLVDMLHSPAVAVPHSIPGQLAYIQEHWGYLLGPHLYRLLRGIDLISEEEKVSMLGPGPSRVYEFEGLEGEPERYSRDRDWMPSLVLLAKNAYVWLDQLSKRYGRPLTRLDHIPDEEVEVLARRGFSGLWLIGLWERSPASQKIKQMCGNPDAVASAYSLMDYRIAADLGGDEAFQNLRGRAWERGIRLSSDMVPNHVGIDSRWVIEHPDWFIALDHSPFPSYTFRGPDLSQDERVGIYLEDHYYDRSDAAVVFKRVDHWTGSERYIYHGNDGTSMPWNDTAQLDYLKPEVREAVIQTILHVARNFPIIRFDAAMTLTKKHTQRLWFPEPGAGGAIPSRAEHGLTKAEFDARMPNEFWREVVDRIAEEVPDTLLLAEAFWLLEGYFVRTLGMHRVYNSAFMNMLRDEDNAKYRTVMKNTLEFDPQVLKRYVNFMNNPDEETAVNQFGKGDKYFGICTLMATMPGLPMFGHGQVEGLSEKYGMEYHRAYWDEQPDAELVERHEREVFPLLHRRRLFAEVDNFLLYDFYTPEGHVNEDVFAYSNRAGGERALVIYHNRFADTRGSIRTSAAYAVRDGADLPAQASDARLVRRTLGEGLGLSNDEHAFTVFRDQASGLEYIRNNRELFDSGLTVELGAYQRHVFLDFRQVRDDGGARYSQLTAYLQGRGVPSIDEALREVFLQPVHSPFRAVVNAGIWRRLIEASAAGPDADATRELDRRNALLHEVEKSTADVLDGIGRLRDRPGGTSETSVREETAREVREELEAILQLRAPARCSGLWQSPELAQVLAYLHADTQDNHATWGTLLGWLCVHNLGKVAGEAEFAQMSRSWIDEWMLGRIIAGALQDLGLDQGAAAYGVLRIKVLTSHQDWYRIGALEEPGAYRTLESLLVDTDVQQLLQVNRYRGILWFNRESLEELLWWMMLTASVVISAGSDYGETLAAQQITKAYQTVTNLQQAIEESGFQVELLLEAAQRLG